MKQIIKKIFTIIFGVSAVVTILLLAKPLAETYLTNYIPPNVFQAQVNNHSIQDPYQHLADIGSFTVNEHNTFKENQHETKAYSEYTIRVNNTEYKFKPDANLQIISRNDTDPNTKEATVKTTYENGILYMHRTNI